MKIVLRRCVSGICCLVCIKEGSDDLYFYYQPLTGNMNMILKIFNRILLLPNYVSIKEVVRFQIADVPGFSTCKQSNLQPNKCHLNDM